MGKKKDTIFDDIFRAILERMPHLILPLINEAFHTDYTLADLKVQMKNEHVDTVRGKKQITDSLLNVRDKRYHVECQRKMDNTLVIRIFDYAVTIALEEARNSSRKPEQLKLAFPSSCVLYLTDNENVGNSLNVPIEFPDGYVHNYSVPVLKAQAYSKEEIFQKDLLMLLPYYILRYEKQYAVINKNPEKQEELIKEYESICHSLYRQVGDTEYNDLVTMIKDVVTREMQEYSNILERMDEAMSGCVYELHSERMMRLGREEEQQKAVGMLIRKKGMTEEEACEVLEVNLENYRAYKNAINKEGRTQEHSVDEVLPRKRGRKL